jgi:thiol-disulfide isomerase/thioredoxin
MYNLIALMSVSCPYCIEFKKIYDKLKKKYDDEFIFNTFDVNLDKEKLINNFSSVYNKYHNSGVPTIVLKKKNKHVEILMPNIDINTNKKKFYKAFVKNIKQALKTLKSKKYDKHLQKGGDDDLYFKRYLKYKKKYYLLKNSLRT